MAGRAEALSRDARADVIGDFSLRSPKAKGCVSLQSLPRVAASTLSLCRPVWPLSPDRFFLSLSSNSKCNTTGPDGLRCCHVNEILSTHECGRP